MRKPLLKSMLTQARFISPSTISPSRVIALARASPLRTAPPNKTRSGSIKNNSSPILATRVVSTQTTYFLMPLAWVSTAAHSNPALNPALHRRRSPVTARQLWLKISARHRPSLSTAWPSTWTPLKVLSTRN